MWLSADETREEKVRELKDVAIKSIQSEAQRGKKSKLIKRNLTFKLLCYKSSIQNKVKDFPFNLPIMWTVSCYLKLPTIKNVPNWKFQQGYAIALECQNPQDDSSTFLGSDVNELSNKCVCCAPAASGFFFRGVYVYVLTLLSPPDMGFLSGALHRKSLIRNTNSRKYSRNP